MGAGLGLLPADERVGEINRRPLDVDPRFQVPLAERHAQAFEQQAHLQMRDDEGRRQNLEAEDAIERRALDVVDEKGVVALFAQGPLDPPQHRNEIRAGAAARVENEDFGVGKPVGDA